jgi:phosphate transport system substrate-binding protein
MGATFPVPLYERWIDRYRDPAVEKIEYRPQGSSAGIEAIAVHDVDFAGSDAPMTDDQLSQAGDVLHIPMTMAPIAVAYNLPGASDELKLTPEVLADIFLGEITRWDDPRIAQLNSTEKLPPTPIRIVHRSDGSGTTKVFTSYLSAVSGKWKKRVGSLTSVAWPVGEGAEGNPGVARLLRRTEGGMGYVVLAFARANYLKVAALWNKAGRFVPPSLDGVTAAAVNQARNLPEDLRFFMVDAEGERSYPITAFSYILVRREADDAARGAALVRFLWWGIHDGQAFAPFLGYAELPPDVIRRAEAKIRAMEFAGKPLMPDGGGTASARNG